MAILITPVPQTDSTLGSLRATQMIQNANAMDHNFLAVFKSNWEAFWDASVPLGVLQAQLDYLANTPATDVSGAANALAKMFAIADRAIAYALTENPEAFDDAVLDVTGAMLPAPYNTIPYQMYKTPGWYYTLDTQGRMVVTAPCNFGN